MTKQLYKASLADIVVSQELINKTKLLMKRKRDGAPKHTMIMRYASLVACFAVMMFAVITVPKLINKVPSGNNPSNFTPPASVSSGPQTSAPNADSVIYVNQLGNMIEQPSTRSGPAINRIEKWTFEQYCDLLGFTPLPTAIPEGLNLIENDTKDISFRNDSRMDFYNTWSFVYTSGSGENAKNITVHVNPSFIPYWSVPRAYQLKGEVQITDVNELLKLGKKSEINGTEVTIWRKDKGSVWDYMGGDTAGEPLEVTDYYCADFEYKGAGFTVTAQNGIIQDEFVQVLESIIK